MMQIGKFSDGSFYIHRILLNGKRYSGYYNANGTLKDCEQTYPKERSVSLKMVNIRAELERIGKVKNPNKVTHDG